MKKLEPVQIGTIIWATLYIDTIINWIEPIVPAFCAFYNFAFDKKLKHAENKTMEVDECE